MLGERAGRPGQMHDLISGSTANLPGPTNDSTLLICEQLPQSGLVLIVLA